jgi:hypothetical protein
MHPLVFKQRKWWKSEWDLYQDRIIVGSLTMDSWSYSKAVVMIGTARWEIGYIGWTANKLYVRDPSGMRYESIPRGWLASDADIRIGPYRYALMANWWHTRFYAQDESRSTLVEIIPDWWRNATNVSTQSPNDKTTLLLAFILFYRYKIAEASSSAS